jgi:vacuolar-type H+-ATPase subunit I/STV1
MTRKNHKTFALPTSPVFMSESRGIIEQLYLLDYAELTFETLRLRRWKMAILNTNFVPALEKVFTQLLEQSGNNYGDASATAKDMAHRWFANKKVKKNGAKLLRQCGLDKSAIEAEAFRKSADKIELIDKLLASAESRRSKIIRELAAYRNGLAQQLEKSANRIIEAEVLTHDDAVKNAVVEQAEVA